jgi:hypothetical protein
MADDRTEAVNALLVEAEAAHGAFETTELNGVYDQEWARWYAAYAVEHGIGALVGHELTTDQLGQLLADSYLEFERADPTPSEAWAAYAARRLVEELGNP